MYSHHSPNFVKPSGAQEEGEERRALEEAREGEEETREYKNDVFGFKSL